MARTEILLELARRRAGLSRPAAALEELRAGLPAAVVVARTRLPPAAVEGVAGFYELLEPSSTRRICTGTACRFARGDAPLPPGAAEVSCVGRCYEAPAVLEPGRFDVPRRALTGEPAVLRNLLGHAPPPLEVRYARPWSPAAVLDRLEASGLRGRGGAAYPTAAKWRAARAAAGEPKHVVANGDEGDPGSYVDRLLLEEDPHAVLAGLALCAHAIGATRGVVFIRAEYPRAAEATRAALRQAEAAGLLPPGLVVEVRVGAGSYVCGEETALLRAIEGLRGEPTPKPPYPTERGLYGCPTVVQNVETLALVPWVLSTGKRPETKAFCLSGAVARPGVVEAPFGTSLRALLREGGGGPPPGRTWKMALVGGPMGCVVAEPDFDVPLAFDTLPGLGHGGIVVLDDTVSARALAEHLFEFARSESCGQCTPCRVGTARLASVPDRAGLERLLDTLALGSLCGFGQGVPRPLRDLLRLFPTELFPGVGDV